MLRFFVLSGLLLEVFILRVLYTIRSTCIKDTCIKQTYNWSICIGNIFAKVAYIMSACIGNTITMKYLKKYLQLFEILEVE